MSPIMKFANDWLRMDHPWIKKRNWSVVQERKCKHLLTWKDESAKYYAESFDKYFQLIA